MSVESATAHLLTVYRIPEDSTKIYPCSCNFVGSQWDQDMDLDFAGWYLGTQTRRAPALTETEGVKSTLHKVRPEPPDSLLSLYDLGPALLEAGWCEKHAAEVTPKLSGQFILEQGYTLVTAEWFPTWEAALATWRKHLKTLEEMGIE